jgi:hypothetical protein
LVPASQLLPLFFCLRFLVCVSPEFVFLLRCFLPPRTSRFVTLLESSFFATVLFLALFSSLNSFPCRQLRCSHPGHCPITFSSCSRTPVFPVYGTDVFSLDSFPCACLGLVQLPFLISSWISLSLSRSAHPGALPPVPAPAVADLVRVLVLCFRVCHDISSAAQICFGFKC